MTALRRPGQRLVALVLEMPAPPLSRWNQPPPPTPTHSGRAVTRLTHPEHHALQGPGLRPLVSPALGV